MEKRKGKDRRRFTRLSDRRQQMIDSVSGFDWFGTIVGLCVLTVIIGYWYILVKF